MERVHFIRLALGLVAGEIGLSGCGTEGDDGPAGSGGKGGASGAGGTSGAGAGAGGMSSPTAGSGGTSASECTTDALLVPSSSECHDHLPLTAPITAEMLNAETAIEYYLPLDQNHRHTLLLTTRDLLTLRGGEGLTKTSSSESGHTHTYQITCM
jgi:hypothetical protein